MDFQPTGFHRFLHVLPEHDSGAVLPCQGGLRVSGRRDDGQFSPVLEEAHRRLHLRAFHRAGVYNHRFEAPEAFSGYIRRRREADARDPQEGRDSAQAAEGDQIMPTIAVTASVAANTRTGNALAGELFEFLPSSAIVAFYATGSAAGLQIDISVGGETIVSASTVPPTNRYPIRPDDAITQHGGLGGERLFASFSDTPRGGPTH